MYWRKCLAVIWAVVILSIVGAVFAPTTALAQSCSLDMHSFAVGVSHSFDMSTAAPNCGVSGGEFSGFSTDNTRDLSGASDVLDKAVGFTGGGSGNPFVSHPTTLTSSGGHASVTFNQPGVGGSLDFNPMEITVNSTDGVASATFNFFCDLTPGGDFRTDTPCTLTITLPSPPLTTTQAVASTTTAVGSASTLTFTLTNPNTSPALSGVADSVSLPSGVTVASTPNASSTCGSFSPTAGATSLSVSGGTLAASGTCTFRVDVTSSTSGAKTIPTGVPSATGTATGVAGTSATLTVNPALTTTQAVPSTTLTVNSMATPFTPVTASGGTGTLSFALSGATLPTGLSFSTLTGQITGTPTTTSTQTTFTVTVTDQTTPVAQTSSKTFDLTVNPAPLVTTQAVANAALTVGSAASLTPVTASGGTGTLTFALTGGTLPPNLNFSASTGQITGTPIATLTQTTFTVTVTDQTTPTPQTSFKTFNLTVNSGLATTQAVPSTTLTAGSLATPFIPVTASGGTGTLSFALSGGTLPAGLAFSTTTGQITGTPATPLGQTTFTVTVTDQTTPIAQSSFKTFVLTVNPGLTTTQAVASTTLTAGSAATPFTPVTATGGTGTLSFALSGGTLPTGLNFSTSTGQITGTPTATLVLTTFTVTVTDQTTPTPQTSAKTFGLTVNGALTTTQAVPSSTLIVFSPALFTPVTAFGGTGTRTFALSGAILPTGLNFSTTTGQIAGTPTTALALTTFTVTVTDQTTPTPQTSSKTFNLTVNGPLVTTQVVPSTTLTVGSPATPFTPVTAAGGTGTLSFALSGGTLPTGLNFSTSTGQITGTPTTALALTTFTVTVTDQTTPTAQTSSKTFNLTVNPALTTTQAVASTTLTVASAATPFTPVTASGGTGTLSFALSGGTLPTGLNFTTSTGQITGTPTAALPPTTFTVTVTDQTTPTPQTSAKTFTLTVNGPLVTTQAVPSTTLTVGSAATPFTPVTAVGGTGTLSFALSGGVPLPTGLNFSTSTGQITGTPTATLALTPFTVTVTDQTTPTAQTSAKTFNLAVVIPALVTTQAVPSTTLSVGSPATPFTPVTASGGTGTLSFALSGGVPLPTGLNFSTTTGQITGTPTAALALTTFTVTVTDQTTPTPQTSSKTFSLTVVIPALTTTQAVPSTTLTAGSAATPFTPVTASGGTGTLSFALSGGTLPSGLTFSTSTGQITGTPTTILALTTFTVTVTDQATPTAQTSSKTFSLRVTAPSVVAASSSANTIAGVSVTVDLTNGASGGPFTGAQLVSLSPASAGSALVTLGDTASNSNMVVAALVSGGRFLLKFTPTPAFAGTAVATFTLGNAFGTSAPATVTFTVTARPDPSKDAEVAGVVNAQAQAAQHFATNQITNFNDRLEKLHDGNCYQNSFGLGLNDSHAPVNTDPLQKYGVGNAGGKFGTNNNGTNDVGMAGGSPGGGVNSGVLNAKTDGDGVSRRGAKRKHVPDDSKEKGCGGGEAEQRFAAWTGGFVNYGRLSTGVNTGIDYVSTGLSAGIDYWFSPAFAGGFGIGYGNDKSTIGVNGTVSKAFSYNAAVYGSWHPSRYTFLDAVIGYGVMNFDSNRFITGSGGEFASGSRSGHQIFGSVTSGYEYRPGNLLASPYARVNASWSTLDAFTESGGGVFALQYGTQTVNSLTGGFGLRAAYKLAQAWGAITPRMRIEYAHEFAGASIATVAYADLVGAGGSTYALPITQTGSDFVTTGLGVDLNFINSWILSLDYRSAFGQEKTPPQMLQMKLMTKF